jgi:hypothetical protein
MTEALIKKSPIKYGLLSLLRPRPLFTTDCRHAHFSQFRGSANFFSQFRHTAKNFQRWVNFKSSTLTLPKPERQWPILKSNYVRAPKNFFKKNEAGKYISGSNPTIVSYNASVTKNYSATYSIPRFYNWNYFSLPVLVQDCQIFIGTIYPDRKKCTEWTQNVPNYPKTSQMSAKYFKWP